MRVGVDASCWANQRGYGRYTRELLKELLATDRQNEYLLFIDAQSAAQCHGMPPDVPRVTVPTSQAATQGASASGRRSARHLWAMRQAVYQHGNDLDLFYFPSVYTYFPPKTKAKVMVTIHDTTAERYPQLIFPNRRSRLFWRIKVKLAVRRADLIATVSEASKREIMREFRVPEERVAVIPDAVGAEFYPLDEVSGSNGVIARYGVEPEAPFILYVGGISPHKNLRTLIDAHALLLRESGWSHVNLVLLGDYQKDVFYSSYTQLRDRISSLGTSDKVVFTGFVDDTDLTHFYNAASALVMPSFDEGFGLPALEAMATGTPVIASNAGALPEVVGDAGRLFNPHSAPDLQGHLAEVLSDPKLRNMMRNKGLQRARQFSWHRSAQSALAIFDRIGRSLEPAAA